MTTPPQTPYEQASYDLNKFRERRMAERRATPRGTPDRRINGSGYAAAQRPVNWPDKPKNGLQ